MRPSATERVVELRALVQRHADAQTTPPEICFTAIFGLTTRPAAIAIAPTPRPTPHANLAEWLVHAHFREHCRKRCRRSPTISWMTDSSRLSRLAPSATCCHTQ